MRLVLCVPNSTIFLDGKNPKGYRDDFCWVEKDHAEYNPSFLQVIPYVLVANGAGDLLYYSRGSESEGRLDPYDSVGFGGHVEAGDGYDIAQAGRREIREELGVKDSTTIDLNFLGWIRTHDDVGSVHVGACYYTKLGVRQDVHGQRPIGVTAWITMEHIAGHRFERWSVLAADLYMREWHNARIA